MTKHFNPPIDYDSSQTPVVWDGTAALDSAHCDHKLRIWDSSLHFWRCALCKYIYGMEEL